MIFLPGFMTAPKAYRDLLQPVAEAGWTVIVPQLYPRGVAALLGRYPVGAEARGAAGLVAGRCVLGGHSRGGQAAWLAAGITPVAAVVLVDPVDGEGRRPSARTSTAVPAGFASPCLIIGAGIGGKCAPALVNHEQFAAATEQAEHVVVDDLGHADILSGRAQSFGRRLCGGGAHPDRARARVSTVILEFLTRI